ncbi:hypothetical protein [Caballeronia novacaledonica]|uniref:Uncharacterized protein n=1 Tax=Caballeronia novacaledonica TaxID=1544861 RepID=A0AA37IHH0_9BURK|nr:hypothetical protein [Caballeronia novacaledonica]GJH28794.1 hypothetical protein CBA19CS42_29780 [Caballeronia novacaledonica]
MSNTTETRASTIDAVKTPLGFLVLGLLILDGTLGALAIPLSDFRTPLVWTIICSVAIMVAVVVALATFRPEALRGDRPWQEVYANQLADDLFMALDGALGNLEHTERIEAWLTVADVISTTNVSEKNYHVFCSGVAARLTKRADLQNRRIKARGAVQTDDAVEEIAPTPSERG